jgi:hypothetical protein
VRASRAVLTPGFLLGGGVAAAAFLGSALLIAADFNTLIEIKVQAVSKASISAGSHHSYALVVLGAFALLMAWGAVLGGSRPALLALAGIGLGALAIALAIDFPDVHGTGSFGSRYEGASAAPRLGFYVETLGAVLLIVSGAAGLILAPPRRAARRRHEPGGARRRGQPADVADGSAAVQSEPSPGSPAPSPPADPTEPEPPEPAAAPTVLEPAPEHSPSPEPFVQPRPQRPATPRPSPLAPAGGGRPPVRGRPRAMAARAAAERLARRARERRRKRYQR